MVEDDDVLFRRPVPPKGGKLRKGKKIFKYILN